jgi:hypothetical protein
LLGKAIPAIHRSALRWFEGDGSFFSTAGTNGSAFNSRTMLRLVPLDFALFTPFGFIFEILAGIKLLFARSKDEFSTTIDTHKRFVCVFHSALRFRNWVYLKQAPVLSSPGHFFSWLGSDSHLALAEFIPFSVIHSLPSGIESCLAN